MQSCIHSRICYWNGGEVFVSFYVNILVTGYNVQNGDVVLLWTFAEGGLSETVWFSE
jgi:hypothetical protein